MNIKAVTKYQINEYVKSVRIYYLVILLVCLFFGTLTIIDSNSTFKTGGGLEGSTIIFLFILGLNSFKESFFMMLQNGTTRKSMFIGRLATIVGTGIVMALIDRFLVNIGGLLYNISDRFYIIGLHEMIFDTRAESLHIVIFNLEAILITMSVYITAMLGGYFITTAYYRMNKMLKIAVSISVPTSIFILLPILDSAVFKGKLSVSIGRFISYILGIRTGNPYILLLTCVVLMAVSVGLTWLLIRKAVEKK